MENPYKPPSAPVRDPPPPPRSPVVAVLAGLGVDLGGTILAGLVLGIAYAAMLAADGMDPEQIGTTLTELDPASGFFLLSAAVGCGFSLLGGYVCARMVRRDERRVTVIMGLLSAVAGFLMGGASLDVGLNTAMLGLTFLTVVAGGELGRRRNATLARAAGRTTAA